MVVEIIVPEASLLSAYDGPTLGVADSHQIEVPVQVTLEEYLVAFLDSPLFRFERMLLGVLILKPTGKHDVLALASGENVSFSAWDVERRSETELLMTVKKRPIKTWFSVEVAADRKSSKLMFGSAVLPASSARAKVGLMYRLMSGFHRWYSQALLSSAAKRLRAKR